MVVWLDMQPIDLGALPDHGREVASGRSFIESSGDAKGRQPLSLRF